MSEVTDIEVITWALDNGWKRIDRLNRLSGFTDRVWAWENKSGTSVYPNPSGEGHALKLMRRQYLVAHKPPLSERVVLAVDEALNRTGFVTYMSNKDFSRGIDQRFMLCVSAVQRVLDEDAKGEVEE